MSEIAQYRRFAAWDYSPGASLFISIAYNPLKWQLMYGLPGYLSIKEPLSSPRLDCADYWKGVGNVALLAEELNLVRRLPPACNADRALNPDGRAMPGQSQMEALQ